MASVGAAAASALVAGLGAVLALAADLQAAPLAFALVYVAAGCAAFAVASVRRDRWPWWTAVTLSTSAALVGLTVLVAGLARRDGGLVGAAGGVALGAALVSIAYLRAPTRAWHGFACPGCDAFRWPMWSPAARTPCARCGAPGPANAAGSALPRWAEAVFLAGWIATMVLTTVGAWRSREDERARLAGARENVRVVGWDGYEDAIATIAHLTGAHPVLLGPGTCARAPVPEHDGRAFVLDEDVAERILLGSHAHFLEQGLYLFRCERGGASGRRQDVLALVPATDPRAVVRRLGTGAPRHGITPEHVVAHIEALASEAPFHVTEVGLDYVAGYLEDLPLDTRPVADRILQLAPAVGTVVHRDTLSEELRRDGAVYLWWPDEESR